MILNPQNGSPFGSVWVHSLTLAYVFWNIKCDSWASLSACTFLRPYFNHEIKVKVVTGWQR
jgi:hypothetical protein